MDKKHIRKASLAKRDALTREQIEEKSRQIFEKLMELNEYRDAENILVYASMRSEVLTDDIILDALANGKKVFCPKVTDKPNGIMEFVRIMSLEELKEGYFGISEPELTDDSEIAGRAGFEEGTGCSDKTLVIMPGAAFDRQCNRIGYGGGFYDRYLKRHPEFQTVALSFECQILDELIPVDEFDVKPTALLTEETATLREI
ncbi:5-formyltetrahydrofolate cyclo-ligase [Butyrivibrio sp. AE2032]|uniref:5-formyltetrahydrofolate cyclo-ligase n=1 Tax=Butyrivibrio sp. AE2032 TaxID=1458463 RepID=UPI0005525C54|nr:5-formyltetrahydrofolate cyclo-ligase [Butyrivibrio sp. AE2032]